ncbi:unnamed protein product [Symbiodinium sp. CCMP2456]|nr:unnamed protein product [Symbiodinium sp. CCMP2456]
MPGAILWISDAMDQDEMWQLMLYTWLGAGGAKNGATVFFGCARKLLQLAFNLQPTPRLPPPCSYVHVSLVLFFFLYRESEEENMFLSSSTSSPWLITNETVRQARCTAGNGCPFGIYALSHETADFVFNSVTSGDFRFPEQLCGSWSATPVASRQRHLDAGGDAMGQLCCGPRQDVATDAIYTWLGAGGVDGLLWTHICATDGLTRYDASSEQAVAVMKLAMLCTQFCGNHVLKFFSRDGNFVSKMHDIDGLGQRAVKEVLIYLRAKKGASVLQPRTQEYVPKCSGTLPWCCPALCRLQAMAVDLRERLTDTAGFALRNDVLSETQVLLTSMLGLMQEQTLSSTLLCPVIHRLPEQLCGSWFATLEGQRAKAFLDAGGDSMVQDKMWYLMLLDN